MADISEIGIQTANQNNEAFLAGHLGIEFVKVENGYVGAEFAVKRYHLAPNGYLHAGSVVTLADSVCGYGCISCSPKGASNFTTVELKSNFLGTATIGVISCKARAAHKGRSTQI